jgi:hypothetical protein
MRFTDINNRIYEAKRACNRGDAQELLLASAVYSRLATKQDLKPQELINFVLSLPNSVRIKHTKRTKQDRFNLYIEAKQDVVDCVLDPKNYGAGPFAGIVNLAVKYANQNIKKQVDFIQNNKRKDAVAIDVVGTRGDKIDVSGNVTYNDENGNEITEPLESMNLSVKVASKKFGQASGFGIAPFTKLFGIMGFEQEVQPILKKHEKKFSKFEMIKKDDKAKAVEFGKPVVKDIYNNMARIMKTAFANERSDEVKEYKLLGNLANAIQKELVGSDDFVDVVQFDKDDAKGYAVLSAGAIKRLKKQIKKSELDIRMIQKEVNPSIQVFDKVTKKLVFEVRSTFNKYAYLRNFLDQGPFMDDFKEYF